VWLVGAVSSFARAMIGHLLIGRWTERPPGWGAGRGALRLGPPWRWPPGLRVFHPRAHDVARATPVEIDAGRRRLGKPQKKPSELILGTRGIQFITLATYPRMKQDGQKSYFRSTERRNSLVRV